MKRWIVVSASLLMLGSAPGRVPADRKTGIRISENGRHFVDLEGKPFFWQGDTQWELLHLFSVSDAKELLMERRSQGFNVVQVMVTGVYPEWGAMKGMKPWRETSAWLDNNPLTPNEEYFRRADAIIAAAEECGIVLILGVYHARDNDEGRIDSSNVGPWSKWLARRYRAAPNIVWGMYPHAEAASEPVIRAAARGLREGDGGAHLITMHPDPSPKSSSFMHTEPWLAFNTLQTWSRDFVNHSMVRSDYARLPAKPVVDGEARYEEEDGTTPFETRRVGYWACLAGGFYSYGHRDNWKSPQTWRRWYRSPGAAQMKVMGDVFRSLKWWRLVPDQSLLLHGPDGTAVARSADGDWLLAYLTSDAPVTLNTDTLSASGAPEGWWINPVTGARTRIDDIPRSAAATFVSPRGWQDALLLLKKSG